MIDITSAVANLHTDAISVVTHGAEVISLGGMAAFGAAFALVSHALHVGAMFLS